MARKKRSAGLALGSGGARGLCSIGVLLWLKEHDVRIECVSGSSIGSIIGGAFAAGFTPEFMKEIATSFGWKNYLSVVRFSFGGKSILGWEKMEKILRADLGGKKIEDLAIPFACVASDIDSGSEFVFREGDLVEAMSASACMPGIFPPVKAMGMHLVDGEILNPIPINLAKELGAEKVIGVNACRSVFPVRMSHKAGRVGFLEKVDDWMRESAGKKPLISPISSAKWKALVKKEKTRRRRRNIMDVFTDSLAIATARILALTELKTGPHFMINPEVGAFQTFDFDRAGEIIDIGYAETERVKDELFQFLDSRRPGKRRAGK